MEYKDYSHSHCFTSENPPCGIKGKHRCCLCNKALPLKETKKQYLHETRTCEFPDCKNLGRAQGAHADGTPYRRAWCGYHLKGTGRKDRELFAKDIRKYKPRSELKKLKQ